MSQHMAVELLSSYLDEEVTRAQLRLVEDHLRGCSECRGTLAGLSSIAASVRRLEAVQPPSTLAAAVDHRVRLAASEKRRGFGLDAGLKRWLGQPVLAPVFAIVLALGAIFYLFAFGVSQLEERPTRLVLASAAEDHEESKRSGSSAPSLGVSRSELDTPASPPAGTGAGRRDLDVADASFEIPVDAKATEPTPASESVGGQAASVDERRTRLLSELKVMREEAEGEVSHEAVTADATATPERDSSRPVVPKAEAGNREAVSLARAPRSSLNDSLESETLETLLLAGRTFVERGGVWIEVGLEGQSVVELVDLRTEPAELEALDEDWSAFRDLGRVRLRVGDRVVEVIYPPLEHQE